MLEIMFTCRFLIKDFSTLFKKLSFVLLCFILVFLFKCKSIKDESLKPNAKIPNKQSIFVMTYNVENLFDTEESSEHEDKIFLPLSYKNKKNIQQFCKNVTPRSKKECLYLDWTEERLNTKLERIAKVVLSVNQGLGPDILLLQEVENKKVLKLLISKYLKDSGYQIHHFKSADERGIGVAILTRLKQFAAAEYHEIDFVKKINSRGILYVPLILPDASILHVFNFHFPSQARSTTFREQAMISLNKWRFKYNKNAQVIAAGDTNITTPEEKIIYPRLGFPNWFLSHYEGCKKCLGTVYYPPSDSWSFFDVIFFSPALYEENDFQKLRWRVDPESIHIANNLEFQLSETNTPKGYSLEDGFDGVSDHWPMVLEIVKKP